MKKNIIIYLMIIVFAIIGVYLFYSKINKKDYNVINKDSKIIYENTISPNGDYVDSEKDKIFYTIKIYQNNDNNIIVKSSSNSEFNKDIQYELEYDKEIYETDINVKWTTLMGDENYTKENQIAIAVVTISSDNKIVSQRKINFVSKAIDIIVDIIVNR
jgi:hypothetical protein